MQIKSLFTKPIDRSINGVIKAEQLDQASVWQELDEYVVTKQVTEHIRKFFDAYLQGSGDRMGVWVSGFFGSGKSHFIKIISYLLENKIVTSPTTGESKKAADFFDSNKIKDPMLVADIQKATQGTADVILFNIDSKADSKDERDVILQVFLRVFNEKLGYSGDAPHIANMERYLESKGVYEQFKQAFKTKNGNDWLKERDAFDLLGDDIVYAISTALGNSIESAEKWFDNARDSYKVNIDTFAKVVSEYLETKDKNHRVIFLVDEVGQFIGNNTQLMLNLQTITEELGVKCNGRAWVIVTSQADIDAAIGEANKAKSQDFSKIQGRFHTRLSLASSNVDEVISKRLLAKTDQASTSLKTLFQQKGDIINNQLVFVGNSVTYPGFKDAADFSAFYPFAPHQFLLVQKIFEAIRKVGATGSHLSRGERSLLDAFQSAAIKSQAEDANRLIPVYDFYPSIESFIDTVAKRSIEDAPSNPSLIEFDVKLLKGLFLIRYISDSMTPNIDNIATLCVTHIDEDKINLRKKIQESLTRLEQQRLISRNGDLWYFLTNEERDIANEVAQITIGSTEKSRLLAEIMFDEVFNSQTKIRHRETKGDYEFNRLLDGLPYRNSSYELVLDVLTPLGDDYDRLNDSQCVLKSNDRALIKINEIDRFDIEITHYLQIENFIVSPKASNTNQSTKVILQNIREENRGRKARIIQQLKEAVVSGDVYVLGQSPQIKAADASTLLDEVINYLVSNSYNKLSLLKHRQTDAWAEIRALLNSPANTQTSLGLLGAEANPEAINELKEYLLLAASTQRVLLSDVVKRFTSMPYGWKPESEIVLLITRLFMAGEIKLAYEGGDLDNRSAADPLTKPGKFSSISILKRKSADADALRKAKELFKEVFKKITADDEDTIVRDFRSQFADMLKEANGLLNKASLQFYPGKEILETAISQIQQQLNIRDSFEFVSQLNQQKTDWLDFADDLTDIRHFYSTQVAVWSSMLEALNTANENHAELEHIPEAQQAIEQLKQIRSNATPWGVVSQIPALVETLKQQNSKVIQFAYATSKADIEKAIHEVKQNLAQYNADADLSNRVLQPLQSHLQRVAELTNVARIKTSVNDAHRLSDNAIAEIAESLKPKPTPTSQPATSSVPLGGSSTTTATVTPTPAPKIERPVEVDAARFSSKLYLESEAEVEAYVSKLKAELLGIVQSGKKARIK
jgi:hypothetical protein